MNQYPISQTDQVVIGIPTQENMDLDTTPNQGGRGEAATTRSGKTTANSSRLPKLRTKIHNKILNGSDGYN